MKKLFLLLFAGLLVCCFFVGCDQDAEPKVAVVSFDANGATGRVPSTINVRIGKSFSVPSKGSLEKRGYDFAGWNTSPSGNGTQFASYRSGTANEDMTLYAQWKIHTYSIEYDYMYGELPPEEWNRSSYTVDTGSFQLANPTREGYEFLGWKLFGSDDSTAKTSYLVEKGSVGDLHFVAVWRQLSSWTVSYNANGGNGWVSSQTKYEGGAVTILDASTIERKGYGFVCWNTKKDGSGMDYSPNDTYDKEDSLSLYAKWKILEYSIKYDLAGGSLEGEPSNPDSYTVESDSFTLKNPVKEGHVFLGWKNVDSSDSTAKSNYVVEKGSYGDRSLVAVWRTLKEMTISFYVNAASSEDAHSSIKVMEGGRFVIPSGEELSRNGYDFAAWNTQSSGNGTKYEPSQEVVVDCDLKLYAQWSLHNYRIDCDLAGGCFPAGSSVPDHYTIKTRTFALNEPSKNGSTFLGWKLAGSNDSSANKSVSIEKGSYGDLSFVAVWGHVISYDSNGGKGSLESQTKPEGAALILAVSEGFSRNGYEFDCWNTKADGSGINYQPGATFNEDRDTTLYVKWTTVSYPIKYDFNGGYLPDDSFNLDSYTIETDTFALANPKRNGDWSFIGWKLPGAEDQTAQELVKIQKGSTGAKSFVSVWGHFVSYNINGGYGEIGRQIKYEKTPLILASLDGLSRKGYSIDTWNTSSDGSGTNYNPGSLFNGDRNMVLYAKWDIEHYEISYDLNGGAFPEGVVNPREYTVETPSFELCAPIRDGYKFLGWKLAGSDDSTSNPDIKILQGSTGDKSYVAVWQPLNSYWVQYVANGSSGSVGRQIKYEGVSLTISDAAGLSRDGYDFVCWNTSANGSGTDYKPRDLYKVDSNLTLYAQWRIVSYKVEYDLDGGTLPVGCSNPMTYTMESESFTLVNPSKEDYEFLGWKIFGYPDSTACKTVSIEKGSLGAKAFVAVWRQLNRYSVKYNANGGTGSIGSQSKLEGRSLMVSSPLNIARTGYSFKEWNTQADGSGESYNPGDSYSVDKDLVLYASWNAVQYLISYNLDGGILPVGSSNPISYTIEYDSFTLNNPTKEGYVFLGWKLSGSSNSTAKTVFEIEKGSVGNKSLVAVWRQLKEYTISYNVNGGSGSVPSQAKLEGDSIAISKPEGVSRNGYMFACWNTMPDGSGKSYNPNDIFSRDCNLNLYAEWDVVKYTISYDLGVGTIPSGYDNPKEYDVETDTIVLTNPEMLGYKFLGWKEFGSSDETAKENVSIVKGSTGNKSFVAVWKQLKKYTVEFDANGADGGSVPISLDVYEGFLFAVPSCGSLFKESYAFYGWNTDSDGSGVWFMESELAEVCDDIVLYAIWKTDPLEYTYLKTFDSYSVKCKDKSVTSVVIPCKYNGKPVTQIESEAFISCKNLVSLEIPTSVTHIGSSAFGGCSSLTNITIPSSVTSISYAAFSGCSSLGSMTVDDGNPCYYSDNNCIVERSSKILICGCKNSIIPDDVTGIGRCAFQGCSELTEITIPSNVTSIGQSAFGGSGLTKVIFSSNSVEYIDNYAFSNCRALSEMILPSSVTYMGSGVFEDCRKLLEITIPSSLESIGYYVFAGCISLESIIIDCGNPKYYSEGNCMIERDSTTLLYGCKTSIIPSNVTSIGFGAFEDCSGLVEVSIPSGVTRIEDQAFTGCSSLTGIDLPEQLTYIGRWAFYMCKNLTVMNIPEKVSHIGEAAFFGCNGLTGSLTIPYGVTSIGTTTFYSCIGLTDIIIPSSVTSIGSGAFTGCNSLKIITIPSSVTRIDSYAFSGGGPKKEIHYAGSSLQWEAVSKDPNWDSGLTYTLFFDN